MSQLVSAEVIEKSWQTAARSSAAAALKLQAQCRREQRELADFVVGVTADLQPEAVGLALYIHVVVAQAFRFTRAKFGKVTAGKIERAWTESLAFIEQLKAKGYAFSQFIVPAELTDEPAVMQYVVDALTEKDEADPVNLNELEFWHILRVLKTVSDCMHGAVKDKR